MSNNDRKYTAREAAQAVLQKAHEILAKSETLKKYETENRKAPLSVKYGKIERDQKPIERDYKEYEVKSGNSKDSSGPRLAEQISPSGNPKEEAEGNNKSDGMEPRYEFKDKIKNELAKENEAAKGMPKDRTGNPGLGKSEKLAKKYEGFKAVEESAAKSGARDPAAVAAAAGREKYGKEAFQHAAAKGKKMGKAENPDKEEDAKLGEKVEKDVEEHMLENAAAEKKEGHKIMKKSDGESKFKRCMKDVKENSPSVDSPAAVCVAEGVKPKQQKSEEDTEKNIIPRLVLSAKLSKFMEHMHSKRKHGEAQSPEAVGHEASDAPLPGSAQDGEDGHEPKKYGES